MLSGAQHGGLNDLLLDRGYLSGIHAALRQVKTLTGLLVAPVDMPLLTTGLIRHLCRKGRQEQKAICCESVVLPISPQSIDAIDEAISSENSQDYSLFKLHKALIGVLMPVPAGEASLFKNANTPTEWSDCLSFSC